MPAPMRRRNDDGSPRGPHDAARPRHAARPGQAGRRHLLRRLARRGSALFVCGLAVTVAATVTGTGPATAVDRRPNPSPPSLTPVPQRTLPEDLPASSVHPGSVVVAFDGAVRTVGARVASDKAVATAKRPAATATQVSDVNDVLDSLGATSVKRLFANIPADQIDAARARAEAATGAYVTDFTQVYQVTFDPAVNDGAAANRLARTGLVSAATPDWVFSAPEDTQEPTAPEVAARAHLDTRTTQIPAASTGGLPTNYAYVSDGQSYLDAAATNVTGAWTMLRQAFGVDPGAGEVVTNISLGRIDDGSTVLEGGQRYLEQRGYPRIPTYVAGQTCVAPPGSGTQTCTVTLDGASTNADDPGQAFDLGEAMLDFSVMAPPPRGDSRVVNPQAPGQTGEILGAAYGAGYRLVNPRHNSTPDLYAAFLGAGFLQSPRPSVITASISDGAYPGFPSGYFIEEEAIIHDIVSLLVNGLDIFVSISAGDGQTDVDAAMDPDGVAGATEVTRDPAQVVDINSSAAWTDPRYSYLLTSEPQYVLDSGAADVGGVTLNDVFASPPTNTSVSAVKRREQTFTETRWNGQQNFSTGFGSRVNIAAPADNILFLEQVPDRAGGPLPTDPTASRPALQGGDSAAAPMVAASAAIVRQTAKLLGTPLSARDTRNLLARTGRANRVPDFDLGRAKVGRVLDTTAAVKALFDAAGVVGSPQLVRMTVAQRKALPYTDGYARGFYTDTPQDPDAGIAFVDLGKGLSPASGPRGQEVADTGDNINSPMTFAVDAAWLPSGTTYRWTLAYGGRQAEVDPATFDATQPSLRVLPSDVWDLLGQPVTASGDRQVTVTVTAAGVSRSMRVSFAGQADATYTHAVPPSFAPVYRAASGRDGITFRYDLRGLRDGSGGTVDGGVLLISDIDRILPRAFPDRDPDAHGIKIPVTGVTGKVTVPVAALPNGAGTYGVALRGTTGGTEIAGSTSSWVPLRYAPADTTAPSTPKVAALVSGMGGQDLLFYDIVNTQPGGSSLFSLHYDVRSVPGARGALVEFSSPATNVVPAVFLGLGEVPLINRFTNPDGDRLDRGNRLGQPGSAAHATLPGTSGTVTLDGAAVGLRVAPGACDATYQVRVFATDASGAVLGVASSASALSYADLSRAACGLG